MKDIYIKDEGEFATVIAQSDKAKKLLGKDLPAKVEKFNIVPAEAYKVVAWAVSHNMTVDSEINIIIPATVN